MRQITVRLDEETIDALDREADERGITRSERIRNALESRGEVEELRDRLEQREARIDELTRQLSERSRVEEKIEELPDKIREARTYSERRQRLLDQASLTQRIKWKVTGVPVEELEADEG